MRKIIYYVAASIDGFIAGPDEDISGFVQEGAGVDQYLRDLQAFGTVIMGRKTYEFGYRFGLQPGQPAYPHMEHHIFSTTLAFEEAHEKVNVHPLQLKTIRRLREQEGSDIHLCGGGAFAGWLLEHGQVSQLKLKLNPLLLGRGTRLFGGASKQYRLELLKQQAFDDSGLQIITYDILY